MGGVEVVESTSGGFVLQLLDAGRQVGVEPNEVGKLEELMRLEPESRGQFVEAGVDGCGAVDVEVA